MSWVFYNISMSLRCVFVRPFHVQLTHSHGKAMHFPWLTCEIWGFYCFLAQHNFHEFSMTKPKKLDHINSMVFSSYSHGVNPMSFLWSIHGFQLYEFHGKCMEFPWPDFHTLAMENSWNQNRPWLSHGNFIVPKCHGNLMDYSHGEFL